MTREALKMLAAKGLLSARPKQGTFVRAQEQWNLFDTDMLRWLLDRRFSVALLRQFNELRIGVEPQAATMRWKPTSSFTSRSCASGNPFYIQLRDIVTTALRTSIRFTNRIAGRTASARYRTVGPSSAR